jgi:phosphoribosyl 1,2-cyclic phosphate phosphodiesterase
LVINALRKKKHISHFTLNEALNIVNELSPRKAFITHVSHQMGLHAEVNKELPKNVQLAYDRLSFTVK